MKTLTFVKLGYISPDEAIYNIYNFFFSPLHQLLAAPRKTSRIW